MHAPDDVVSAGRDEATGSACGDAPSGVARWGRYVAWLGLALWAGVIVVLVPLAGRTAEVQSTDAALILPRTAEATRALVRERDAFPGADAPVAVVVYVRDGGVTEQDRAAVEADRRAFGAFSRTGTVEGSVPSDDGTALLLTVPIAGGAEEAAATVGDIKDRLAGAPAGLDTAVTGSAGAFADAEEAFAGADTALLLAAAGVVAVLLLVTYRSPLLWLVPLVSVGLASQIAAGVVYLLARYAGTTVTETSNAIMLVLVFGVGTDYALLIIARYREELRRVPNRYVAMLVAWRRSFPAILASAATVVVGMLCLLAGEMNDVRGLGPVAAAGIAVAFAVMTTMLPILLVLLGRWVFWPFVPRYTPGSGTDVSSQHGIWKRVADAISRRPRPIWTLTALGLAVLSVGVVGFRYGQPADRMFTTEVGSVVGQRLVAAHFPDGTSAPAQIITAAAGADQVTAAARTVDGVAGTTRVGVSADGRWVRIDAVLDRPPDSDSARATVDRIRRAVHGVAGADALVGGQTATTLDIERASARDNRILLPLILLVVLVVLALLLRALVAPLLLAASVVLSFAAAMGLAGLISWAIGFPDIAPNLPLWGYLLIVTLGVDYTIFLMTRAREEATTAGTRAGILTALTVTGGVITSAGVVLAATFATLLLLPAVATLHIGLVVAIGVLIDTFLVRTMVVPTLAIDIGDRIWWPSRPRGPA